MDWFSFCCCSPSGEVLSDIQSRVQLPTRNAPSGVQNARDIGVSIRQVAESNEFIASFDPIYV